MVYSYMFKIYAINDDGANVMTVIKAEQGY